MNRLILSSIFLAVAISVGASACKTNNPGTPPPPPAPVPPAGYAGDVPLPPAQGGSTGGRFGFTGAAPATSSGTAPSAPGPAPAPAPTAPTPPPSSAPTAAEMPFANPVPGNPLAVTLPGANASLGQISVEKFDSSNNPTGEPLKRGTQVQIPDPNNPGKKIYFKVP